MTDPHPLPASWRWIVCLSCRGTYTRPARFVGNPPCRGCGYWPVEAMVQARLMIECRTQAA